MRTKLFYIVLSAYLFSGACTGDKNIIPVEANVKLDSTILGISVVARNMTVPWDLLWGPDNRLWFCEQKGNVYSLDTKTGEKKMLLKVPDVWYNRTAGLLGMALYNDTKRAPYLFIAYTVQENKKISSRLVRYTFREDTLTDPKLLLEIPGNKGHNGTRLAIAGEKLFWATGDAQKSRNAQDTTSLNGKILRLNIDGSIPADNPVKGSPVWAWGFRNMQGLVFSEAGLLYMSEHGDASDDEVNLIQPGNNYGWPSIEGYEDKEEEKKAARSYHTIPPLKAWTPTIAPCGIVHYSSNKIPEWKNSLILTTLKGRSLRVLQLNKKGDSIVAERIYLEKKYGRLRDVCISPEGDVYVSASNRDWNPYNQPDKDDDRILRIHRVEKETTIPMTGKLSTEASLLGNPKELYNIYCAGCHKEDGSGSPGVFTPLSGSKTVTGNKNVLIQVFLEGLKREGKTEQMPSFKFLSNEEAVSILNYVRNSWKNEADSINASDVERNRKLKTKP